MENRAFDIFFGKFDNKKRLYLCFFTTATAIKER